MERYTGEPCPNEGAQSLHVLPAIRNAILACLFLVTLLQW